MVSCLQNFAGNLNPQAMMKFKKMAVFILFLSLAVPAQGNAQSSADKQDEEYVPTTYFEKITYKFEFGLKNLLGGWTEIYYRPADARADGKNLIAAAGTGIAYAAIDTVGGLANLITFPVPQRIPLPGGGAQIRTAFDDFKKANPELYEEK